MLASEKQVFHEDDFCPLDKDFKPFYYKAIKLRVAVFITIIGWCVAKNGSISESIWLI